MEEIFSIQSKGRVLLYAVVGAGAQTLRRFPGPQTSTRSWPRDPETNVRKLATDTRGRTTDRETGGTKALGPTVSDHLLQFLTRLGRMELEPNR